MIKARASGFRGLPLSYEKGQAGETPHSAEFLLEVLRYLKFMIHFTEERGIPASHNFTETEVKEIRENLIEWYRKNKRDLPWRNQVTHMLLHLFSY